MLTVVHEKSCEHGRGVCFGVNRYRGYSLLERPKLKQRHIRQMGCRRSHYELITMNYTNNT